MGSRRWIGLVGLLLLALAAAGCGRTYYAPEIAGIVTAVGPGPNGATRYLLANGLLELTIDIREGSRVVYGGRPNVGDLLLSGTGPNGPWIARVYQTPRTDIAGTCFEIRGPGTDRGEWIETDAGLRLHKAPGFTAIGTRHGDRYEGSDPTFCLGPDGQVTSFQ